MVLIGVSGGFSTIMSSENERMLPQNRTMTDTESVNEDVESELVFLRHRLSLTVCSKYRDSNKNDALIYRSWVLAKWLTL